MPSARDHLLNLLNSYAPAEAEAAVAAYLAEAMATMANTLEVMNPDRGADFSAGVGWAIDTIRSAATKTN